MAPEQKPPPELEEEAFEGGGPVDYPVITGHTVLGLKNVPKMTKKVAKS